MRGGRGYNSGSRGGSSYRPSSSSYNNRGSDTRKNSNYRDHNSSYNSHSRSNYNSNYNGSSNYDSRNNDRFSSRHSDNRYPSSTIKRAYQPRDRSDDRKRTRHEDSRVTSNYSSSSSYRRNDNIRRPNSPPGGGGGHHQDRGTTSSNYRGHRDGSSSRRNDTSMGPPKRPMRSNIIRPRGTIISSRLRGGGTSGVRRLPPMRGVIRRPETTGMRIMRRKLLLAHQRDRARMLKIARLTSSLRKRREAPRKSSTSRKSRNSESADDWIADDDVDDAEGDSSDDKKKEKEKKKSSGKDESKEKATDASGDEKDKDDEDESKKGEETSTTTADKDSKKKEGKVSKVDAAEGDASDSEDKTKEDKDTDKAGSEAKDEKHSSAIRRRHESESSSPRKITKKSFIKLTCVHCRMKCLTFKEYTNHLYLRTHKLAMRRIAIRQKSQLARMRQQQRNAQRDLEENSKEDLEDLKPQFCLLCRLNYRQPKAKHQLSEHHKAMKKFLMPYCSTCHLAFKSPMVYESHRCSLDHIKRKARNNDTNSVNDSGEEREVDLANFLTVDSIGEIDDDELDDSVQILFPKNDEDSGKEKVNVGAQYVKKTDAFYCELCRIFYPYKEDEESFIKKHCSNRSHLKAYIRQKEDEDLQAKAERVERSHKVTNKKTAGNKSENNDLDEEGDGDEGAEDKLWEDVDKDLGDLLREVGPDGQDDEDEEEDESVLNIDIESEKQKSKELNGKSKDSGDDDPKEDSPTKVSKVKKETEDPKPKAEETAEQK